MSEDSAEYSAWLLLRVEVIAAHAAHVEKVLVDALSADVDVAFLQELNQEVAHQAPAE